MFSLGLLDYYGRVSSATNGGTCSISSPSTEILLTEVGQNVVIQDGISTFSQFQVTGAFKNHQSRTKIVLQFIQDIHFHFHILDKNSRIVVKAIFPKLYW